MIKIKDRYFVIIVLACLKLTLRFKETEILRKWLYKHEGIPLKIIKKTSSMRPTEEGYSDSEEEN